MARTFPVPLYLTSAQANGPDIRTLTTSSPGTTDSVATKLPFAALNLRESYARPEQTVAAAGATGAILSTGNAFGWGWLMDPVAVGIVPAATDGFRLLAGSFTLTFHYARDGGVLTADQNNVLVTAVMFRASSTGSAVQELGRGTVTVTFTTTEQVATITVGTVQAEFDPGQRLYLELHVSRAGQVAGDQGSHIRTNSTTATRFTAAPQYDRLYNKALSDAGTLADALARTYSGARALADSSAVDESLARQFTGSRALADAAAAADVLARQFTGARSLTDTAGAADSLTRAATYARSITDATTTADAVTRVVAALRSLSDTAPPVTDVLIRRFTGSRSLADSAPITDAIQRAFTGSRSLADTAAVSDTVTRRVSAARSLADTAPTTADSIARAAIFSRSIADASPVVVDALMRRFTGSRSLNDAAPAVDMLRRATTFARRIQDDLSSGATPPAPIVYLRQTLIFDD